ncbi:MAG: MFS transporter, partial [Acetobacteraceae bacterium]
MTERPENRVASGQWDDDRRISRLMLLFAIVYVVEGVGQARYGVMAQPLTYFLKTSGWTPVQVTGYLAIFTLPWVIKPVYGIVSDFVPLFGYRRKSYLLIANAVAAIAYGCVVLLSDPGPMALALTLTAYGMAIASTMCGGLLVEAGQRLGASDVFVNQQWLWFSVAGLASAVVGGQLVQHLPALTALRAAAAIGAFAPLVVLAVTPRLVEEERHRVNVIELKRTLGSLAAAFRSRTLWLLGGFLFLDSFSPSFGTPLYFYMTDELKFSQSYIGILTAIASAGWIVGALFYHRLLGGLHLRTLLNLSIALGTLSAASYLLLSDEISAAIVNFLTGISGMVTNVATLTLAAHRLPETIRRVRLRRADVGHQSGRSGVGDHRGVSVS